MSVRSYSFLSVLVVIAALSPVHAADDLGVVKDKLFEAKKEYDGEVQKFRKAVTEFLDKREEAAREAGNKKLVDQIKAERKAFEQSGEFPTNLPALPRTQLRSARADLDKAYTAAVKGYLRLKEDALAETAAAAQQALALETALMFGKRTYLTTLKHFDLKVENPTGFSSKGTDALTGTKLELNGQPIPHSIFIVPPTNGSSEVSYPVPPRAMGFRTTVGVTRIGADAGDPGTALTFELLGDGVSLWRSKPVTKLDMYETCEVRINKVRKLTLRVHCPGPNTRARAMWYESIVAE